MQYAIQKFTTGNCEMTVVFFASSSNPLNNALQPNRQFRCQIKWRNPMKHC